LLYHLYNRILVPGITHLGSAAFYAVCAVAVSSASSWHLAPDPIVPPSLVDPRCRATADRGDRPPGRAAMAVYCCR
jgi:hypothetical protein